MKPTEILSKEHRIIEQVLACLEQMALEAAAKKRLDARSAQQTLEFFRVFADRCHHGKEEAHLFPMMEAKGFPHEDGPLMVMRSEHDEGRAHVRAMAAVVEAAGQGAPEAIEAFRLHAAAYIELLRAHIQKEDHRLFPMADRAFEEEDQKELLRRFERVEHDDIGAGAHEAWLEIANLLADRFDVPRAMQEGCPGPSAGACGRCSLHAAAAI